MRKYLLFVSLLLIAQTKFSFSTSNQKKEKIASALKAGAYLSLAVATGYLALKSYNVYKESMPQGTSELWTSRLYNSIIGDGEKLANIPILGKIPKFIKSLKEVRDSALIFSGATAASSLLFGAVSLKYFIDAFKKNR